MRFTLLDRLHFTYKESINQSSTFTRYHVRYDIKIMRTDNKRCLRFEYQCNPKFKKPNLKDCLYCYVSDAMAYEDCDDDIQYFADMLGYEKIKETLDAFNACKEAYLKLLDFCETEGIYKWLKDYYSEY